MSVLRYASQAALRSLLVVLVVLFQMPTCGEYVKGFPDNVRTTSLDPSSVNTSCYMYTHVNETHNETTTMMIRGAEVTKVVTRTRVVRTCCAGYSGEHCNITSSSQQPQATAEEDPCRNLTCSSNPDALCAVVTKCGEKIPMFLDSAGVAVDCGNHRPVEELRKTSCGNVCSFYPYLGKTCSRFPNAICLTTPCDCKPLWLLETGVRVDCSSGEQLLPQRTRRQSQTQSHSCNSYSY